MVEEVIEKYRSGEQDTAEFWINKPDLFIYITYTAVRDEKGQFRGVLERMQDCTCIRNLSSSQTLLTWENHKNMEPADNSCQPQPEPSQPTFSPSSVKPSEPAPIRCPSNAFYAIRPPNCDYA